MFGAWTLTSDNPFGGEPVMIAAVAPKTAPAGKAPGEPTNPDAIKIERPNRYDGPTPPASVEPTTPANPPGTRTVTIIDGSTGKRQEVPIPVAPDNQTPAAPEAKLVEATRHGPIPKLGPDGARPSDAYARPVKALPGKPNAPRVAIIVSGLGVSAARTNEAIKLPDAVTLAFVPYGSELAALTASAQRAKHELILQVPMEPFDYPNNDPGPQTLLTSIDAGQNVDRLHWAMSRFQSYVGIGNYMGARFTASEQALAPVMREAAKRGLIYVDDGASARSLASQFAGANNMAFAKADVLLDAVATQADIDRALARLENMARSRGAAVGIAQALPLSIARIARWAKAAEGRGILLVPISALANKPKSS
jgi:polysaccharide deacetylase 2 family uncharacterized protein YibQ